MVFPFAFELIPVDIHIRPFHVGRNPCVVNTNRLFGAPCQLIPLFE